MDEIIDNWTIYVKTRELGNAYKFQEWARMKKYLKKPITEQKISVNDGR